ncbi:MAG TPA: hypothetical protein VFQ45_20895, partial [Longimicrobium sp.]|nr:hypothetical protein [Longimicrobium sp.]
MRYPGEVWFLPPDAREQGDPKPRRHVLLNACDEGDAEAVGSFAFASTQSTEAGFGAAYLLVDPAATRYGRQGRTGFPRATYVYASRIVPAEMADLQRMAGRLIDEMADLREKLRVALGLGTGTAVHGTAAGSWRGRFVRFTGSLAAEVECDLALVLTEPAYSNHQRYQVVVPLRDASVWEPGPGDVDLRL